MSTEDASATASTSSTTTTATTTIESSTTSTDDSTTGDPTTGDPTTGDPTNTASTTGDTTTGGVCLEFLTENPDETPPMPIYTCGLPALCVGDEPLWYTEDGQGWQTDDFLRARCMAAAMRDRTLGQFQYQQPALGYDIFALEILGEQVIIRRDQAQDFNYDYSERVTFLRPPEFFADCAVGSGAAVHECLENGFTDECASTLECPG